MSEPSIADREIAAVAERLKQLTRSGRILAERRGSRFAQLLRRQIGAYGAWGEDKLPMHQRARKAARYESEFADLLWPGRDADA